MWDRCVRCDVHKMNRRAAGVSSRIAASLSQIDDQEARS
jgi:hypothetical protein